MGYQQPYPPQQPQYYAPPPVAPTSGSATASLIFSILGLTLLPTIGSIIGLILGYSAKSEIDRSGGQIGGRGLATWGIALGWIGVAIALIGICLGVLVFAGVLTLPALGICAELGNLPQY